MKESYLNSISQQKYIFLYSFKNQTRFIAGQRKDVNSESTSIRKCERVEIESIHFCL